MDLLSAFDDELSGLNKQAGIARRVGGALVRNPMRSLGAAFILLPALAAGAKGYAKGRRMGKPARMLRASRYGPSSACWTY